MTIPATRWANLARSAWANGMVDNWGKRLEAYVAQQERREEERGVGDTEGNPFLRGLQRQASELRDFVNGLASSLVDLGRSERPQVGIVGQPVAESGQELPLVDAG